MIIIVCYDYHGKGLRGGEVAVAGNGNGISGSNSRLQHLHHTKEETAGAGAGAGAGVGAGGGAAGHQPRLIKSRTSLEMHSNSARGMKAAHQQQDQTAAIRPLQ